MKKNALFFLLLYFSIPSFSQDTIADLFRSSYKVYELQRNTKGIYRDSKLFSGSDFHPASVANVGIGLMALCIADSMQWVTNAEQLAEETLKSMSGNRIGFTPDRNATGFYRHFINMNDGSQMWGSEYSTIDSGIFLCGALFAKKYFNHNTTIANYVEQIYNAMDWSKVIADAPMGKIYRVMQSNGNGEANSITLPFNEYMIVAWLAMKAEGGTPGTATQLWNLYYKDPNNLPNKDYQGISLLTDNPNSYLSSFTLQFPYYMCPHFRATAGYMTLFENARQADSLWFTINTSYNDYEWGLGAGSYNTGSGYHADKINNNPSNIVSPQIMAGFIPVYPEAEQELLEMYRANKGIFTLPNSSNPKKILWRYSNTIPSWSASEVQGIDYSSMLFGLASLSRFLGEGFFTYYNDYDFPPYGTPTNKIETASNQLKIYPNPVKNSMTIEVEGTYKGKIQLRIFDMTGKRVQTSYFTKYQTTITYSLPVENLAKGFYIIDLEGNNIKLAVEKMVKL